MRCPLWRPTSVRAKLHPAWRSRCSSRGFSPSQCRSLAEGDDLDDVYGKFMGVLPVIDGLPIIHGDFPWLC